MKPSFLRLSRVAVLGVFGCGESPAEAEPCPDRAGILCTWAGTGELGFNGDGLLAKDSDLYWPVSLTFDAEDRAYILDWNNHRVREVTPEGLQTVIGTGFVGDGPDDQSDLSPPGALGTDVVLNHPTELVPQPDGTFVLVAWHNHKLRTYDPRTGRVLVTCGRGAGFSGDGGPVSLALLNQPSQLAIDADGIQYVLDQRNQVIRQVDPTGKITTLAGTPGEPGFAGDGGPARAAKFEFPAGSNPPPAGGLALDASGNLYVSDTLNHRVRKIDAASGTITTLAGDGTPGFSGDDGPAEQASLNNPRALALGPDGRLYLADEWNHRIRAIDLLSGSITTVVGNGEPGDSGDGGAPRDAALNRPASMAFDRHGVLYVVDTYNSRIRRVPLE